MAQIYFQCSNAQGAVIDRCGVEVSNLGEAHEQATWVVHSLIAAPSLEDWRNWALHVSDDLGEEIFIVPFASALGKAH